MTARILVVEDEADLLDVLVQLFRHAGYEAVGAADGLAGLQAFEAAAFDLVVLDVMMSKIDGFTLCEAIRARSDVPIMVATALSGDDDQIKAFSLLADDYVTKPFSLPVVLERVRALLRRAGRAAAAPPASSLSWRGVTLDLDAREAFRDGRRTELTKTEFDMLSAMMKSPGHVFTRTMLAQAAGDAGSWASDGGAVKLHVMNIRRKLGSEIVQTVRGVGYRVPKDG